MPVCIGGSKYIRVCTVKSIIRIIRNKHKIYIQDYASSISNFSEIVDTYASFVNSYGGYFKKKKKIRIMTNIL